MLAVINVVTLLLLPCLISSFRVSRMIKTSSTSADMRSYIPQSNTQSSRSSVAVLAYSDIAELNNAIRKNSSMAYELFNQQKGIIDFETAYLTLAALTQQRKYKSLDQTLLQRKLILENSSCPKPYEEFYTIKKKQLSCSNVHASVRNVQLRF